MLVSTFILLGLALAQALNPNTLMGVKRCGCPKGRYVGNDCQCKNEIGTHKMIGPNVILVDEIACMLRDLGHTIERDEDLMCDEEN